MRMDSHSKMRLSDKTLEKIRRHEAGTEGLSYRTITCHHCEHKTIQIFEDSSGHIRAKCKKCGEESTYNLALRRMIVKWNRRGLG